jgi:hypothetical protein
MQRDLIEAILNFPGHIIATMRSKTEWQTGAKKPTRVGLAPEQGKGIEYEFDILFEINPGHLANIIKDRSGKFQDKIIDRPDKKFGLEIAEWLSDGAPVEVSIDDQVKALKLEFSRIIQSKDDSGNFYFTESERARGKGDLVSLIPVSPEERKIKLTAMLEEKKQILSNKVAGEIGDAPTVPQKTPADVPPAPPTPAPAAAQTAPTSPPEAPAQPAAAPTATAPSSPPPKDKEGQLTKSFKEMMADKHRAAEEAAKKEAEAAAAVPEGSAAPSLYSEPEGETESEPDDGFQDDIPYREPAAEPAQDELAIF